MYTIESIISITHGALLQQGVAEGIEHLVYDSRTISFPQTSLFFALHIHQQDGHAFVPDAYKKGIRSFIIDKEITVQGLSGSTIIKVENTLQALQQLAIHHRQQFSIPVIGITGSNGKTIVKEWLYQLLHKDYDIVRSPKSYNSQIGVPLSVWQIQSRHTLGIFEAGISKPGEMDVLAQIIQPTIGVFTNIGEAHGENFKDANQKIEEKWKLFNKASAIIYPGKLEIPKRKKENDIIENADRGPALVSWGIGTEHAFQVTNVTKDLSQTIIKAFYKEQDIIFSLPFIDEASVQNGITCICVMLYLGYEEKEIQSRLLQLHTVDMRLQLKHGINGCTIINDSYSADITSLHIALHFLAQQKNTKKRTVILSDFIESGRSEKDLYKTIADALHLHEVNRVIAIGPIIITYLPSFLSPAIQVETFENPEDFLKNFYTAAFQNETILVKGARTYRFERLVTILENKVHKTRLEIDLNAITHNLKQYQQLMLPETKVMVMVKAFSYGSGSSEIASILQHNNVHFLGVAYADEGVRLRNEGITLPIMVMNADEDSFTSIIEQRLQPVIYSTTILYAFEQAVSSAGLSNYPVHLEIETGMNRLGFSIDELEAVGSFLEANTFLKVESVFSHLAGSEDNTQDAFTLEQGNKFQQAVIILQRYLSYHFLKHISNSAAIIRHPHLQMDMVRLGIGIYGVEIATEKLNLQPVAALRSTIAQLKYLEPGESVSYNRRGVVKEKSIIATVRIGYADGYSRRFGNGVGKMWVNGHLAPVIGTVCMDMTMIDVTHVPDIKEGDEVIILGKELPVQQIARWIDTIPYEIMTSISQRVKRVYFQE